MADASELVMLLDADLTLRYVNRLDPEQDDPIGHSLLDYTPEAYHQTLREAVADALDSGHPCYFELEVDAPDNETSWYMGWVVELPERSRERLAIIAENVTDRYRTQRALAAEQDLFRSLVDNAPDHVMIVDREHRVQFVNRVVSGWSPDQVMGVAAGDLVPPQFRDTVQDALERVFQTGESVSYETQAVVADDLRWFMVRVGPVRSGDRIDRVSLISTDVTEQKQRADALEQERRRLVQSEERFRTLVEHAPEAVVILDADTGRYVEANENACRLFGMTRATVLASGPLPLSPSRQQDGALSSEVASARVAEAMAGEQPVFEWLHHDADGGEILCEVRLVLLPYAERRLLRGSIMDIGERKRQEAEREQLTAELAQAQKLQAIGQLTGGIAHDFNNLLTVIMSSVEMIGLAPDCTPGIRNHASQALAAAERAAALTQRLLAFARRQPLRPRVVDVNELIRGTEALLRRTLDESIEIFIRLSAGLWPCEIDPTQLENVILNLAINARDAMPGGGRLTIATSNTHLAQRATEYEGDAAPGDYVTLSVSDDGTGMSEAVLSKVFEPFFTTKHTGQGSGLGLSMVYGFVKQSHGHVRIDSTPGQGTRVRVLLPRSAARPDPDPASAAGEESAAGDGQRILVVEDEDAVRALVVKSLQSLGYRTLEAADAAAAADLLQGGDLVDLLLTDVVLPGGQNGPDLARWVRARNPALPVLFMSGYAANAMSPDERADLALLEKPFTRQELARAVAQALHRSDTPF